MYSGGNTFINDLLGTINAFSQMKQRKLQEDLLKQRLASLPQQLANANALQKARLGMLGAQTGLLKEREQLLPSQQKLAQELNQARLSQMGAMTGLAQARQKALPQQQALEQQLKEAQIKALTGKGSVIGIDATGMPIMSMNAAQPTAVPGASQLSQMPQIAGVQQPQINQPSALPSQQSSISQASQPNKGTFLPVSPGSTKSQIASYFNRDTNQAISSITPTGRTQLQNSLNAINQILPILDKLKSYGTSGFFGAPGAYIPIEEERIGAPDYSRNLALAKDLYITAKMLPKQSESFNLAENALKRYPFTTSSHYANAIDQLKNEFMNKRQNIIETLSRAGYLLSQFPNFKGDGNAEKQWFLNQPRDIKEAYIEYRRGK